MNKGSFTSVPEKTTTHFKNISTVCFNKSDQKRCNFNILLWYHTMGYMLSNMVTFVLNKYFLIYYVFIHSWTDGNHRLKNIIFFISQKYFVFLNFILFCRNNKFTRYWAFQLELWIHHCFIVRITLKLLFYQTLFLALLYMYFKKKSHTTKVLFNIIKKLVIKS